MPITAATAERRFTYNGVTLPDPAPGMTVDQVKEIYVAQYPDLATATVEGPTEKNGVATYEFKRKVGTKG